jgi:hypothetical protein
VMLIRARSPTRQNFAGGPDAANELAGMKGIEILVNICSVSMAEGP